MGGPCSNKQFFLNPTLARNTRVSIAESLSIKVVSSTNRKMNICWEDQGSKNTSLEIVYVFILLETIGENSFIYKVKTQFTNKC